MGAHLNAYTSRFVIEYQYQPSAHKQTNSWRWRTWGPTSTPTHPGFYIYLILKIDRLRRNSTYTPIQCCGVGAVRSGAFLLVAGPNFFWLPAPDKNAFAFKTEILDNLRYKFG